ncbi:MAG: hypothetical protein HQL75_07905 [Magnetococcales bacterium]|nr:hypothetical protein [Magnetococcales bacterium]
MAEKERVAQPLDGEGELERRILILEEELQSIKATMVALPSILEKEKAEIMKKLEAVDGVKKTLQDVSHTAEQSSKVVNHLERRVEVVKKDAINGFVVSTIIFSLLMILSIFVRV